MGVGLSAATVGQALGGAVDALTAAGVDSPRLDAELLLERASGFSRTDLVANPEAELPKGSSREFATLIRRRIGREPVAYILGSKGFRSIELRCDRRALIPRPETELLVEVALELAPSRVLDIGTGTGAIALAVASELPDCEVVATDTSAAALELARENATVLRLEDRVEFISDSVPDGERQFDLVLANLPYVSEREWEGLEPELKDFEPREALVSGPAGMDAFSELLSGPSGIDRLAQLPQAIALEVGEGQAGEVSELMRGAGYARIEARADLAGIERVVLARR